MAEMSVIWLRVAAAFYSLGLLHAILTLVRRREHLFRVALIAFTLGSVFHFVSIIEEGIINNRCPIANFYETLSMCAFLVVILYLFQERELKSKKPNKFYYRLPPLGTLDEVISKFMGVGFVLITLAVIA